MGLSIKSIFRYPGGKTKAGVQSQILEYMPYDTKEYREPFVGGGGIFFAIRDDMKRWINDLNPGLIEVYKALRDRPDEFIAKCKGISPEQPGEEEISTKGTGKKYNKRLGEVFNNLKYNTEADQALRYLFINRTVWAGRVNYDPEFESRMYYSNPAGWNIVKTNRLEDAAHKLRNTKITNQDYSEVLDEPGDNVWIYLDPPYVVDTEFNKGSKLYEFGFSPEDHERFAKDIKKCKHKVCISYDDDELVRDLYQDPIFRIFEHEWTYCGSSKETKDLGKELIITNYDPKVSSKFCPLF